MARLARPAIIVTSLALLAPSLAAGFFADDLTFLLTIEGKMPEGFGSTPSDLFRFLDGNPENNRKLMRAGAIPWWSEPNLRVAFLRPLSSAVHRLDHAIWGRNAAGYHVTNLLLWAAVLVLAAAVFKRLAPTPRAATLALAIFALSDARVMVVSWIANRNAMLAIGLFLGAFLAWDVFRRDGKRWAAPVAFALYAVALLAGEAALGGLAFFAAYEAFGLPLGNREPKRLRALVPFVGLAVAYTVIYKLGGYGAAHSDVYIDPASEPGPWLIAAAARLPALIAGVLWAWPVDFWVSGPEVQRWLVIGGVLITAASVWLYAPLVRANRTLQAVAAATVVALLPLCSTFPSGRLLLLPAIGASILMGSLLDASLPIRSLTWPRRLATGLVWVRQVFAAPAFLLIMVVGLTDGALQTRDEVMGSKWPANQEVVLLNAPHWASASFIWPSLMVAGLPAPSAVHALNYSPYPIEVSRPAPRTLLIRHLCGEMLTTVFERLTRNQPMPAGFQSDVGLYTATVVEPGSFGPREVRFEFTRPLEDLAVYRWQSPTYERFVLPEVGASTRLPGVSIGLGKLRAPSPSCN